MDFCGIDAAMVFHTGQRLASPLTWNAVVVEETRDEKRLFPVWAILPDATRELPPPEKLIEDMQESGVRALWAFPQEHRFRLDGDTFPGSSASWRKRHSAVCQAGPVPSERVVKAAPISSWWPSIRGRTASIATCGP